MFGGRKEEMGAVFHIAVFLKVFLLRVHFLDHS